MEYHFQSIRREGDIAGRIVIHNYSFSTSDEELAAFARRNCKPGIFWEVEAIVKQAEEVVKPPVVEKRKPGRPKVIVGMRTQTDAEGKSV